ncbi:D-serine dehydratase [Cryptotermes secundus]|uniref:D-serine dehydratase n=1 Tax=Cryptotermes secundus TaxID=105785 RepID=A0A2J7PG73_9NEOP|nr:D-serine dehydratase isoform X2 [Cryptotermes secundus]PNF15335.1 D-serine dehydratase [Cryptotermes secundus]
MANMKWLGHPVTSLPTPAFLVDHDKVAKNCNDMLNKCKQLGIKLRAQVKTHKTVEGADLQTGGTRRCIVTSTLHEAEMYANNGFEDILYGYPLIPFHLQRCYDLRSKLQQFHVMVNNCDIVTTLNKTEPPAGKRWSAFIKVDAGNNRAGVCWQNTQAVVDMACQLSDGPHTEFQGLYVHCGNSYSAGNLEQVKTVRDLNVERALHLTQELQQRGITCKNVGIGSTPSCSQEVSTRMSSLTEIHPGNYIFYDSQQESLGSCSMDDIAVRVMTRVVSHFPDRGQILIDCGFAALTKQGYGKISIPGYAHFQDNPNLKLVDMTQELGKVEAVHGKLDYSQYPIGSILYIYPFHSCATAAMYPVYYVHHNNCITEKWYPTRGW